MRWSIIRLIWLRDLRDQLRDRRTLFMIAVLPLLLYPVLGYAVLQFAMGFGERPVTIAFVSGPCEKGNFPPRVPGHAGRSLAPYVTGLGVAPGGGVDHLLTPLAFALADQQVLDYSYLVRDSAFTVTEAGLPEDIGQVLNATRFRFEFLESLDSSGLDERRFDLIVAAPENFYALIDEGERDFTVPPLLDIRGRNDEYSKQAKKRLEPLLDAWKRTLFSTRVARLGLPPYFDLPFAVKEPSTEQARVPTPRLGELLMRLFPFMLVMWALAGALYPAVDLCAGEKERGTMETLLITPAGRDEIVLGKFLTIWVFSFLSAIVNLASMGVTTLFFGSNLPIGPLPVMAVVWCIILSLPLSAFFSAISLAIGAYARSSKEGQYYLMPLFFVCMPLIFLTLAPGVELTPFYSLVPVTGVALLMQKLMIPGQQVAWLYFIPVLAPIALYSWLALRWAIDQFRREDVLFREAERLDLQLYIRNLFRAKQPSATLGQAYFLFVLVLFLRWLTTGASTTLSTAVQHSVILMACVAAPTLLMALMLTTRARDSLYLRWPTWKELGLAALLACLLLPPLAAAAQWVFTRFPSVIGLLRDRQPLMEELWALHAGQELQDFWPYLLAFALLPAVAEELAFRGFILTGLQKRFRPRTAIIFSSFLFALYHMNVFAFLPAFLVGLVLGLVTVRSKSIVPAMFLHFLHNSVLLASIHLLPRVRDYFPSGVGTAWPVLIGVSAVVAAGLLWWLYRKPYVEKEREEARLAGERAGR